MKAFQTVVLVAIALATSAARATTTPVNALGGGDGGERCVYSTSGLCSGGAYNGAFSLIRAFEIDLGLPAGSFTRVDDELDRLWHNTRAFGEVQARARYASDDSRLGYDAGSGYHDLTGVLTDKDQRLVLVEDKHDFAGDPKSKDFVSAPDVWLPIPVAVGASFAFVLHDLSTGAFYRSDAAGFDHMVTWRVPDSVPHYFIAWEDRNPGDRDYNDLVVEVRYSSPNLPISPAPEPASYALLLAGLLLLGFTSTATRRRR